jgi:hypothetical protein
MTEAWSWSSQLNLVSRILGLRRRTPAADVRCIAHGVHPRFRTVTRDFGRLTGNPHLTRPWPFGRVTEGLPTTQELCDEKGVSQGSRVWEAAESMSSDLCELLPPRPADPEPLAI